MQSKCRMIQDGVLQWLDNRPLIVKILLMWLVWRLLIQLVAMLAPQILPYRPSFPYFDQFYRYNLPFSIYSWANFDGVHYLTIAERGYKSADLIQAFFPAFPILIRFVSFFINNTILAGLLISNFSTIGALYYGYKLAERWFNRETASLFILVLLTFPTSFYLGAVYNESLFLYLLLASGWFLETKRTFLSGMLAGLSSGVRLVGLMILPSFLINWIPELIKSSGDLKSKLVNLYKQQRLFLLGLLVGLVAFIGYILYLAVEFSDPLYFYTVQSSFGAGRQTSIILLPQTLYRSVMIFVTVRPVSFKYYSYAQDLLLSLLMMFGLVFSWKKIKLEFWLFSLLSFLLPTLTGNLSSMPRYVLIIFPLFIWWANVLERSHFLRLKVFYFLMAFTMLFVNIVLFIQGYWVA